MSEEDIVLGIAELTSLEFAHMIRSVCIFLHMSVRSSALHDRRRRRRRRRRRASFPFEGHALFGCALGLSVLKHQPARHALTARLRCIGTAGGPWPTAGLARAMHAMRRSRGGVSCR